MRFYLISIFLFMVLRAPAQFIYPSTINITGQGVRSGNYQFELSFGESASIITMNNAQMVVTSGVLQSFSAIQPQVNNVFSWQASEISIYPNPVKDMVEINFLHRTAGKSRLELYDTHGRKLMEKQFDYYGFGKTEKLNLSQLANGTYFIHIHQMNGITGELLKQGTYRILKVN